MNCKLIGVYGASGFGKEVMPLVRKQFSSSDVSLVYVDDNTVSSELNGHSVVTYDEFCEHRSTDKMITVAIADSVIREMLTDRCLKDGIKVMDVVSENNVILDKVEIGCGHILCPFVTLTSSIKIGKSFHANIYSYVAHDCIIGDYVTFAPSVKCNGNVVIDDHAYIGTGAVLKQGKPGEPLRIGRGAVVGMGAVVTKDVLPGQIVVGNPAKPFSKN